MREKWYVIAQRYSAKDNSVVKEIIGEFTQWNFAEAFRRWYEDHYKALAYVYSADYLASKV